jgi:hypothetical protein
MFPEHLSPLPSRSTFVLLTQSFTRQATDLIAEVYDICSESGNCLGTSKSNEEAGQCFGDNTCTAVIAYKLDADKHTFYAFVDKQYEYISLAFSEDRRMVSN